jgi:predicted DCC family thiol-disulfide oxidoreductase YuxK
MTLTVLYDATCSLCVRCADFLSRSVSFVPVDLLPSQSAEARERFGAVPWLGEELVVVSDDGEVWIGAAAFLVCLWALRDYREWSFRLSGPDLIPLAERFFVALSANRGRLASFFGPTRCTDGACAVPEGHSQRALYR